MLTVIYSHVVIQNQSPAVTNDEKNKLKYSACDTEVEPDCSTITDRRLIAASLIKLRLD